MALPLIISPFQINDNSTLLTGPLQFSEGGYGAPHQVISQRSDVFSKQFMIFFGSQSPFQSVEEIFQGRTGSPFASAGPRTYVRRFRVIMKNTGTGQFYGPGFVARCPGLPIPFAPYIPYRQEEQDPYAMAVNIQVDQQEERESLIWIVTIMYSTDMPPWGPTYGKTKLPWNLNDGAQNRPWQLPPVIRTDPETYTEYPFRDRNGKPYLNAAAQPFNPPPPITHGYKKVTITRFERDFDTRVEDYNWVVNSKTFKKSEPGYALCTGPRAEEVWMGSLKFHRVTYEVLLRRKDQLSDGTYTPSWQPRILNAGMYERSTGIAAVGGGLVGVVADTLVPIIKYGSQVTSPILLNLNGQEQTEKYPVGHILAGQLVPTWIDFVEYRSVDLNDLTTPQS